MDPIVINVMDLTAGISVQDLSTPLVVGVTKAFEPKLISSIEEITKTEVGEDAYAMATAVLRQRPQQLYVFGVKGSGEGSTTGAEIVEKIVEKDIPHYYCATALRTKADVKALADFYGARLGFYVAAADKAAASAAAIVTDATALATESCFLIAHKGIKNESGSFDEAYADAAMVGKMAPVLEGGAPWFYQSLDGVPDGGYSAADVNTLYKGSVNTVTTYMKRVETWCGKTTKGTYAHFKILKDWMTVRLKEALAKTIHTDAGVFMSNDGLSSITNAMKEVMNVGKVQRGVFESYEIHTPLRADIPTNDRANGIVNGYQIKVKFTGFVEKVTINIVAEV